jgi:hypothetical protein
MRAFPGVADTPRCHTSAMPVTRYSEKMARPPFIDETAATTVRTISEKWKVSQADVLGAAIGLLARWQPSDLLDQLEGRGHVLPEEAERVRLVWRGEIKPGATPVNRLRWGRRGTVRLSYLRASDYRVLRDLARSTLLSQATLLGLGIELLGELDENDLVELWGRCV